MFAGNGRYQVRLEGGAPKQPEGPKLACLGDVRKTNHFARVGLIVVKNPAPMGVGCFFTRLDLTPVRSCYAEPSWPRSGAK